MRVSPERECRSFVPRVTLKPPTSNPPDLEIMVRKVMRMLMMIAMAMVMRMMVIVGFEIEKEKPKPIPFVDLT